MKFFSTFIILLLLLSCKNNKTIQPDTNITFSDTAIPSAITLQKVYEENTYNDIWVDSLNTLDFIKKSNAYIDSFSKGQHGIAFLTDSTNRKELIYNVGYNGPDRFETYYQFYIYPATKEILVYDPVKDVKLSIDEYKKQLNK